MRALLTLLLVAGLGLGGCDADAPPADPADTAPGAETTSPDTTSPDTSSPDTSSPDTSSPDTDDGDALDDAADTSPPGPEVETRSVSIGPFQVPSGVENTMCARVSLGNEEAAIVRAVRVKLTAGSHHLIVHRLDGAADPTPQPCQAFAHGPGQAVIFIAQQRESGVAYPEGAGLPIGPNQTLGLEMHYINYFAEELADITGTVELDLVPADDEVERVHVDFIGPLAFVIPANSDHVVDYFAPYPSQRRIIGVTSHTHQLGVEATIHRASSVDADDAVLLHRSTAWAEPPLTLFEPLLQLPASQGLWLQCRFHNPNPYAVPFGTSFEQEMCFMWVYYIP